MHLLIVKILSNISQQICQIKDDDRLFSKKEYSQLKQSIVVIMSTSKINYNTNKFDFDPEQESIKKQQGSQSISFIFQLKRTEIANKCNPKFNFKCDLQSRSESEAVWNIAQQKIQHSDNGESLEQNANSLKKYAQPSEKELCDAILCLKNKMPQRSIQQIIIRMHRKIQQQKHFDKVSLAMTKEFEQSQIANLSLQNDMYLGSLKSDKQINDKRRFKGQEKISFRQQQQKQLALASQKASCRNSKWPCQSKTLQNSYKFHQNTMQRENLSLPSTEIQSYIYKPTNQEIFKTYNKCDPKDLKFINIEEESKYVERRVMAKAFIERGYGVGQCRKEIQLQGLNIDMHRNKYKNVSGGVIILAFRKLEAFIAQDCKKTVKYLDRWQMRSICTIMLNARTKFEPQIYNTLFKYLKAGFGLEKVTIGEVESVKLYLTIQKYVQGKSVSMEYLERIGEIHIKKHKKMTLQYLHRQQRKRQQRLSEQRRKRYQLRKKQCQLKLQKQSKQNKALPNSINDQCFPEIQNMEKTLLYHLDQLIEEQLQEDVCNVKQENIWQAQIERDMIQHYVQHKDFLKAVQNIKIKYFQLQFEPMSTFISIRLKHLIYTILRLKDECQLSSMNINLSILQQFQQEKIKNILQAEQNQNLRLNIAKYYLSPQDNEIILKEIINQFMQLFKNEVKIQIIEQDELQTSNSYVQIKIQKELHKNKEYDCLPLKLQLEKQTTLPIKRGRGRPRKNIFPINHCPTNLNNKKIKEKSANNFRISQIPLSNCVEQLQLMCDLNFDETDLNLLDV